MTIQETPSYVMGGVDHLDELLSRHLYGVTERQTPYGLSIDTRYLATSNTGHRHELPGAPFTMHSYQWGDCISEEDPQGGDGVPWDYCRDENCWACKPNFTHPGSGLKLWWYKHSHRIPEANYAPEYAEWRKIMTDCENWILAQPFGSKKR